MRDLVSVVIPAYNVSEYIGECLDSILEQDYQDIEIIVVDDGSKDQTGSICDEYAQKSPKVHVIHKDNGGANSARKAGVMASKGRWITLVDGDDTLVPNAIQTMMDHATDNRSIVLTAYSCPCSFSAEEYGGKLLTWSIHALFGKLYSRNVLAHDDVFDTPGWLIVGEDFLSNIRTVKYIGDTKVVCIPECIYNYRQRSGSLMHSFKIDGEYDYKLLESVKKELESTSLTIKNLTEYEIDVLGHMIVSKCAIDKTWLKSLKDRCEERDLSRRDRFIISATDSVWKREVLIAERLLRRTARQILVMFHLR